MNDMSERFERMSKEVLDRSTHTFIAFVNSIRTNTSFMYLSWRDESPRGRPRAQRIRSNDACSRRPRPLDWGFVFVCARCHFFEHSSFSSRLTPHRTSPGPTFKMESWNYSVQGTSFFRLIERRSYSSLRLSFIALFIRHLSEPRSMRFHIFLILMYYTVLLYPSYCFI